MASCVTPRQVSNLLSPLLSPTPSNNNQSPSSSSNSSSVSPRNRDNLYRQLLSSYSTYDWWNKPLPLSPLQCAKWGWQSTGKDALQCKLCKVKIHFVCAFQPWQNAQYDKVCKEFGIQVQTSHLPACPWSNKPLSDDIMFGGRTSLIYDKSDFVKTFFDLFKTFAVEKTPAIEVPGGALNKIWPVLGLIFKLVKNRQAPNITDNELVPSVGNLSLILLSLFGWRKSDDALPTVHCNLCLRTLGLWNFRFLDPEVSASLLEIEDNQYAWDEGRSYMLYPLDGSSTTTSPTSDSRSRELSSASEVSHSLPSGDGTAQNSPEKERSGPPSPRDGEVIPPSDSEVSTKLSENNDNSAGVPCDGKVIKDSNLSNEGLKPVKPDVLRCEHVKDDASSPNKYVKSEDPLNSSASKFDTAKGEMTTKNESPEAKEPVTFGNPDIFLPVASYVLFQPRSTEIEDDKCGKTESGKSLKKDEDGQVEEEVDDSPPSRSTRSRTAASPTKKFKTPQSKTPTSRVLRSRSKGGSSETTPSPRSAGPRKRKAVTSESPPAARPTRLTRSSSGGQVAGTTPPVQPTRKRRKSKLQVTENIVSELMKSSPTQLDLTSSNPSNLDVIKQHHYWCPWVCTLPSYHIGRAYRNTPTRLAEQGHTKVSVVDQTDSTGWETLLFHLSTVKSPGNAWIAVHNMLEDCVSQRK